MCASDVYEPQPLIGRLMTREYDRCPNCFATPHSIDRETDTRVRKYARIRRMDM